MPKNSRFEIRLPKKTLAAGLALLGMASVGIVLADQNSRSSCGRKLEETGHFSVALITSGSATGSNAFWTYNSYIDTGACTYKTYSARIVASSNGPLTFTPKIIAVSSSNELLARLQVVTPHNMYANVPECAGKVTSLNFEIYGDTTLLFRRTVMASKSEPLILPNCPIQSQDVKLVTGEKARVTS